MRFALILLISMIFGQLIGCIRGQLMNGDSVIINKPGSYSIARLSSSIQVEITTDHLVRYVVSEVGRQ